VRTKKNEKEKENKKENVQEVGVEYLQAAVDTKDVNNVNINVEKLTEQSEKKC